MKKVIAYRQIQPSEDKGCVTDFRIGPHVYSIILEEGEPQLTRYDEEHDDDLYIASIQDGDMDTYTPTPFDEDAVNEFSKFVDTYFE